MPIEHNLIPDAGLHTLKGVSTALNGTVPIADGSGGFSWGSPSSSTPLGRLILINSVNDFPTQDSTTIALESSYQYLLCTPTTTSKRFVGSGAHLRSINAGTVFLTYTGSEDMFTLDSASHDFSNISVNCPNGRLFNCQGASGVGLVNLNTFQCVSCVELATINEYQSFLADNTAFLSVTGTKGITFSGATPQLTFSMLRSYINSSNAAFKHIDLGSKVFSILELENFIFSGVSGSVGLTGLASSGNMAAGTVASVVSCQTLGDVAPLSGIDKDDVRWNFRDNSFPSSVTGATNRLTSSTTVTISDSSYTAIGGTSFTSGLAKRFTSSNDGVLTYIGERDINVAVSGYLTLEKVGGGADVLKAAIALNGTGIEGSGGQTQSATPTSVPTEAIITISNGDTIEHMVKNISTTTDIIVSDAGMSVRMING